MNKFLQLIFLIIFFSYLFYGFDLNKIDLSIFNISGIILTLLVLFLGQIILSIRWMKMSNLSFKISFETIIVSSALNMILPAKLGELSKAFYLKKFYKFNFNKVISIIFVERFFDVVVLFLIVLLFGYNYFSNQNIKITLLIIGFIIFFIILFFRFKIILELIKKIPFKFIRVYSQKIYKNIYNLLNNPFYIFLYTLILWSFYFLSNFVFFKYGVNFSLSFEKIFELFLFSTIALSLPLTPAGVGSYEVAVVLVLKNYGISKEEAFVSATIFHFLLFFIDFLLLYIFLFFKKITLKKLITK